MTTTTMMMMSVVLRLRVGTNDAEVAGAGIRMHAAAVRGRGGILGDAILQCTIRSINLDSDNITSPAKSIYARDEISR